MIHVSLELRMSRVVLHADQPRLQHDLLDAGQRGMLLGWRGGRVVRDDGLQGHAVSIMPVSRSRQSSWLQEARAVRVEGLEGRAVSAVPVCGSGREAFRWKKRITVLLFML